MLEIGEKNRENSDFYQIDKNSEKSPGDLRMLAVNQTAVKDHLLTLIKIRKE